MRTPFALQRKLSGDRGRWRTIGRIHGSLDNACLLGAELAGETEPLELRVVTDDRLQLPVREWSAATGWVDISHMPDYNPFPPQHKD